MTILDFSRRSTTLRAGAMLAAGLALSACVTPPPRTVAVAAPPAPAPPPRIFVYPNNGQSADQTERDRYECHIWAVQQTGVDPSRPDAPPAERVVVQSGRAPGSGTAVGAIGGAILGSLLAGPRNAGAGLVLGAATGAVVGGASDANAQAQARQTQAQINQQQSAAQIAESRARADSYRRALSACLQGRGYSIS